VKLERLRHEQHLPDDGIIRKLWINETDAYRDHLLRLDRVSRNRRFFRGNIRRTYCSTCKFSERAWSHCAWFFVDGVLRGAAELRPLRSPLTREGEAAFSIESLLSR
jgi:hypothetical protein